MVHIMDDIGLVYGELRVIYFILFSDDRRRKVAFDLLDNVCKHNDKVGFLRDASVHLS